MRAALRARIDAERRNRELVELDGARDAALALMGLRRVEAGGGIDVRRRGRRGDHGLERVDRAPLVALGQEQPRLAVSRRVIAGCPRQSTLVGRCGGTGGAAPLGRPRERIDCPDSCYPPSAIRYPLPIF